ncbi:MAG: ExbD/TolR family protein [bacterium]
MKNKKLFEREAADSEDMGIVLAPMIDIVFLLLIFFMVSTTFVMQPGLQITLPRGGSETEVQPDRWVVTLTAEREVYLNDENYPLRRLGEAFQQENRPLVLRADRAVPHGLVVSVLDQARSAGIEVVDISTRPPDNPK